ncbi:MAG: tRNA (N6-isopentenyl adenosine(37)-C2)-methylthiotransferase MiaB [Puniceicoccales bacterium]|jgi:tRNA-2-methylthio-N6-dimethylallyladenosine synthase|nr:tRNA (N6-isopentenyl adenosine(37)-C2)-methylthiotransferase MiaB [Puniceicoccales bacterium]
MDPVKKKVLIKTYGCQMNERDTEALKVLLVEAGFMIAEKEGDEDVVLLNTCSVREAAELKALGKAGRLLKKKKTHANYKVGVMGCMAAHKKEVLFKKLPGLDFIAPPKALHLIPELIRQSYVGNANQMAVPEPASFNFSCYEHTYPKPKAVAWIPIQQGCNMACSYCIVPRTRGEQQNRPFNSILKEVQEAVQWGTKEIILLGQIVNTYHDPDSKKNFVDLLEAVQNVEAVKRIRFISPHPAFFSSQLMQAFKHLSKLCPALHLPVQSGSDRILKEMRRAHTKAKIWEIVETLRTIDARASISTDIIVGYPGESEEDFQETVALFRDIKFDMAYIFKYSPRPLTWVAPQEQSLMGIPEKVKEDRNQCLLNILTQCSTEYNRQFMGECQEILIEGKAHRGEHQLFGKNIYNKKVIFAGPESWINTFKSVQINKITASTLEGKVVEDCGALWDGINNSEQG